MKSIDYKKGINRGVIRGCAISLLAYSINVLYPQIKLTQAKAEKDYIIPGKLELITEDSNKNNSIETIVKYDNVEYKLKLNKE